MKTVDMSGSSNGICVYLEVMVYNINKHDAIPSFV